MFFKEAKLNDGAAYSRNEGDVELSNRILSLLGKDENVAVLKRVFESARDEIMAKGLGSAAMSLSIFSDGKGLSADMLEAV